MPSRLQPATTVVVVMDVQERLFAAMPDEARSATVDNVIRMVQGARILGVPVLHTEQYPQGLGATIEPVAAALAECDPHTSPITKMEFDACLEGRFADALSTLNRGQGEASAVHDVVLCGMETHICIYQTARALVEQGHRVHVPYDATCCRDPEHHRVAQSLLERHGASVTTTETVLFELLARAGDEAFRAINKLVR